MEGTTFLNKRVTICVAMPANLQNMPCGSAQCTQDHTGMDPEYHCPAGTEVNMSLDLHTIWTGNHHFVKNLGKKIFPVLHHGQV